MCLPLVTNSYVSLRERDDDLYSVYIISRLPELEDEWIRDRLVSALSVKISELIKDDCAAHARSPFFRQLPRKDQHSADVEIEVRRTKFLLTEPESTAPAPRAQDVREILNDVLESLHIRTGPILIFINRRSKTEQQVSAMH